jgi:SAM-dependent methyltransferase
MGPVNHSGLKRVKIGMNGTDEGTSARAVYFRACPERPAASGFLVRHALLSFARSRICQVSPALRPAAVGLLFVTLTGCASFSEPQQKPDVIFVPTPDFVVARMLSMARVGRTDVVYDLGCGDGRIVIAAAKQFGARGVGFDIDPERVREARANVERAGVGHLVRIEQADIFAVDLKDATVITLYLLPSLNIRLLPKFAELRPGVRIVSHDFSMEPAIPDQSVMLRDPNSEREHMIYLWRTPVRRR